MVKDLGPVNSRGVEKFALEKEHVLAGAPLDSAMIRYLDVGYHNFVPQTFQYRAAILQGDMRIGALGKHESVQLGAQNIPGTEKEWKQRLSNYSEWIRLAKGGPSVVGGAQSYQLPDIPVPGGGGGRTDQAGPMAPVKWLKKGMNYPKGEAQKLSNEVAEAMSKTLRGTDIYKPFNATYWGELMSEFIYAELHTEMMKDKDYKAFYQTNYPDIIQELIKGPGGQSIDMGPYNEQHVKSLLAEIYLFRKSEVFGKDTDKLLGPEFFHGTEETNLVTGKYFQKAFASLGKDDKTLLKSMNHEEALKQIKAIVEDFKDVFIKEIKALADLKELANVNLENFYTTAATKSGISKAKGGTGILFGKFGPEIIDRIVEIARTRMHNNVPLKGYWLYVFPLNYGPGPRGTGGLGVVRIEPKYSKHDKRAFISDLETTTGVIPMGEGHLATLYQFGASMAIEQGLLSTGLLSQWKDLMYADVGSHIHLQASRGLVIGHILDDAALKYMSHFAPFVGLKRIMTKGDIAKSLMNQIEDYANILVPGVQAIYDKLIRGSESLTGLWREASTGTDLEVFGGQFYGDSAGQHEIGIWNRGNFGTVDDSAGIGVPYMLNLTGKDEKLPVTDDFADIMGKKRGSTRLAGGFYDISDKYSTLRQLGPLGQEVFQAYGLTGHSGEMKKESAIANEVNRRIEQGEFSNEKDALKGIYDEFYKDPDAKISEWPSPHLMLEDDPGRRYRGLVMDDKGSKQLSEEWSALRRSQGRTWAGMKSGQPTQKWFYKKWQQHATWKPGVDPTSGLTREEYDEALNWDIYEQLIHEEDYKKGKKRR